MVGWHQSRVIQQRGITEEKQFMTGKSRKLTTATLFLYLIFYPGYIPQGRIALTPKVTSP